MSKGRDKGYEFERLLCREFSLWWTNGERDDTIWRSAASGGLATRRAQVGKSAGGQHGDLAATDSIAFPLMQLITIEVKRGYKSETLMDMVDARIGMAQQVWESFIEQAIRSSKSAGSHTWLVVVRRDSRQAMVLMTKDFYNELREYGAFSLLPKPFMTLRWGFRFKDPDEEIMPLTIVAVTLKDFFEGVSPHHVEQIYRAWTGTVER